MNPEYHADLKRRVTRQQAFLASDAPGDLLAFVNGGRHPNLNPFLCERLCAGPVEQVLDRQNVGPLIEEYVTQLRQSLSDSAIDDDLVPCAIVYWGIGGITAAMTGLDPAHAENTSWLEPHLGWEQIEHLRFDADSRWIQFALDVNRALWHCWEEDFFILPYLHRSPLDAANGIRGTDLFLEMYTEPERVKRLIGWCVDWQLSIEGFLADNVSRPTGWGNGVWGMWLPDRGVFVNGDPVGLVSREMMPEFEQPFTARLFTSTGGGFFHNHTLGLYQVDQVARTKGLLIQEFVADPKRPTIPEVMQADAAMRDTILRASLDSPIMIDGIAPAQLDDLLPIVKEGRFILGIICSDEDDPADAVRKVRAASNFT